MAHCGQSLSQSAIPYRPYDLGNMKEFLATGIRPDQWKAFQCQLTDNHFLKVKHDKRLHWQDLHKSCGLIVCMNEHDSISRVYNVMPSHVVEVIIEVESGELW